MYELKIYWEIMCHDNDEWYKTWWGIDLSVQNWLDEFDKFWLEHSKSQKLHFRLILTKVNIVWSKKNIEELFLMELNIDAKFEGKMTCAFKMTWGI